jgi:hypothetical protein
MADKKFNYTMDEIKSVYNGINDMFAMEGLSEDEEDDLEDYDPEDDIDRDDDDEDEYIDDSEIDDDSDPAEDEDDEYDDVVENVGIANMEEFLSIDELDVEDLIRTNIAQEAIESAFGVDTDDDDNINPEPKDKNGAVRIKDFVSVLDPRPDFEDKSADDILDIFEDEFLNDDDDE